MSSKVFIIMYHYVKESVYSKRVGINNLSANVFEKQLKYFKKNYNIITMEELIDAVKLNKNLPEKALILTFDDGLREHFDIAFPRLMDFNIQGSFFVPMAALTNNILLDIHKIQYVLAYSNDNKQLIKSIYAILDKLRYKYHLMKNKEYHRELAFPGRFDMEDINFVKLLLQRVLPLKVRRIIINKLFDEYCKNIDIDKNFYVNFKQLKHMKNHGMYVGCHGFSHEWLDILNKTEQERDIDLALKYLKNINNNTKDWVIAYPFGAFNNTLISIIKNLGCIIGFTTSPNIADIQKNDIFTLPRIDINYFKLGGGRGAFKKFT